MKRLPWGGLILSALALLCWCAALFLGQSVAARSSGVLVRWSGEEGATAADLSRIRRYAAEDGAQSPPAADLWREKPNQTLTAGADGRSWTGPVLELFGDGGRVWPAAFLSGGYPAQGDTTGVAVDETVAHALWGSADVLGADVRLGGRTYTVRGVFRGGGGLALTQGGAEGAEPYENLLLTFPQGSNLDRAEQWLTASRLPRGTVVDLPLWSWLLSLAAALPGVLLGLGCLLRLCRRGYALRHTPLLLGGYLLPALGVSALLLWAIGVPQVPVRLIPTRWSDFDFWGKLFGALGDELRRWLALTPGRLELEVWLPALGCVICAVAAVGLTALAAERVKISGGRAALMACAAALGLTFACAMAFAGAGGVVLGRSVWLLPTLFTALSWALERQWAGLTAVRGEGET